MTMPNVTIIGAGYVGLVTAACFAEFGIRVTTIDTNKARIAQLKRSEIPIFEPGLDVLVQRGQREGRLVFDTDLGKAVAGADVVFIAVGTPSRRGDGHADLSFVTAAMEEIVCHAQGYTIVVTKSTVPVGTGSMLESLAKRLRPEADIDVCSNPEFLREGSAIDDFMRPNRVVIGAPTERAAAVLRTLYRPLYLSETPFVVTNRESAEVIKYAANAFLATKIAFINQIADLCEAVGADVTVVAKGMGLDGRIGRTFLHAGPGFGGSCFPKDNRALLQIAQDAGVSLSIVDAVNTSNVARKYAMGKRIINACGGNVSGKIIALLGVTFKPNTDDMRESVSLDVIPALQDAGAVVRAYDPAGMAEAAKLVANVAWCEDPWTAMKGADAAVLLTEWNAFRALNLQKIHDSLRTPVLIDLRNVYPPEEARNAGLTYVSVGRR